MNRKEKLKKILAICNTEADKCEKFFEEYENDPTEPTKEEITEEEHIDEIFEIVARIIDIIE